MTNFWVCAGIALLICWLLAVHADIEAGLKPPAEEESEVDPDGVD